MSLDGISVLPAHKIGSQLFHDGPRNLVLDGKHILHLSLVPFRPQMVAIGHAGELGCDPDPLPHFLYAPFEHHTCVEPSSDGANIMNLRPKLEGGGPGNHTPSVQLGQSGNKVVGDSAAKISLVIFSA